MCELGDSNPGFIEESTFSRAKTLGLRAGETFDTITHDSDSKFQNHPDLNPYTK